jgi:hypothetical protein
MIVKNANGADAEDICDVNGLFPAMWVDLAVLAAAIFRIPKGAVSAVH